MDYQCTNRRLARVRLTHAKGENAAHLVHSRRADCGSPPRGRDGGRPVPLLLVLLLALLRVPPLVRRKAGAA
jgi:hypothetical protein